MKIENKIILKYKYIEDSEVWIEMKRIICFIK